MELNQKQYKVLCEEAEDMAIGLYFCNQDWDGWPEGNPMNFLNNDKAKNVGGNICIDGRDEEYMALAEPYQYYDPQQVAEEVDVLKSTLISFFLRTMNTVENVEE